MFDVFAWDEAVPGQQVKLAGRAKAKCTAWAKWYLEVEGYEVLAHVGHEIDIRVAGNAFLTCDADNGARVFVYVGSGAQVEPRQRIYTNADRKPHESGALDEVRRAIRMLELKDKQMRDRAAQEQRARVEAARPTPYWEEPPEPEPEAEPEPASEPENPDA